MYSAVLAAFARRNPWRFFRQIKEAMLTAFDPMLRKSANARVFAVTSSVGTAPRAYWGAYGASKAALETLVLAYGEEVKNISNIRTAIIDPGATATAMRAKAFPGEDASTIKQPGAVGSRIAALAAQDLATGHRERVEA